MITADEARERAREWAARGRSGAEEELGILEFDLGYVVWVVEPPRADPTRPPENLGAARAVVDKQTGALSTWPSLPAPVVAEKYRKARQAEQRFGERVLAVLRGAGWLPGRDVNAAVEHWLDQKYAEVPSARERLPLFPAARAALAEFGGLHLEQYGPSGRTVGGGFSTDINPAEGRLMVDVYSAFADMIGQPVFPLGNYADDPAEFVIDAQGRVFLLHWSNYFFIADTIDGAITKMVEGIGEPPPLDDDGSW
jgi:hypothetical protein